MPSMDHDGKVPDHPDREAEQAWAAWRKGKKGRTVKPRDFNQRAAAIVAYVAEVTEREPESQPNEHAVYESTGYFGSASAPELPRQPTTAPRRIPADARSRGLG